MLRICLIKAKLQDYVHLAMINELYACDCDPSPFSARYEAYYVDFDGAFK